MADMTEREGRALACEGTGTARAATVRPDGRPHVAPVWTTLDGDGRVVLAAVALSVKGSPVRHGPRACLCADGETPPVAFVSVTAVIPASVAAGSGVAA